MRILSLLAAFSLASCTGTGIILLPENLGERTVFVDAPADPMMFDNDQDGLANLVDNCANTPSDGSDLDGDGLGDLCDPRPRVPDYPTPSALGGPDVAAESFWIDLAAIEGETLANDGYPETPAEDSAPVPVERVCRERDKGLVVHNATAPIIEITDQRLTSDDDNGEHGAVIGATAVTVFGSAPLVLDSPFPTIHVPIDDVGSLTAALGELPSYAKYARVCDDTNADGRCSAGEPLLNSWYRSAAGSGDGGVRITVKLIEDDDYATEDPECDVGVSSPLVIDLDDDGIALSGLATRFDLDATTTEDLTGWIAGHDEAILAIDLDGDEIIRSGAELFGNVTRTSVGPAANGFEALAAYDLDGDGMITANDPAFESLRLWSDDNRDGRSQSDELTRLEDAGITAIGVVYMSVDEVDANGNETRQRGVFFRGQEPGLVIDAWFHMLALPRRPVGP